tara:strand:- start:131 stop:598 length:468 start_codon:yes stop_codon:yes gene_type:complete
MSNYVYTTNYLAKDSLPSGDSGKIIKGADFDNDFTAIESAISTKLNKDGGIVTGNLKFNDNVKAGFGNDNDLNIYHTGANSYIEDTGTGGLVITGATTLTLMQAREGANADKYLECTANAAVDLYYNNGKKLETTDTGVTVTGELVATTINGGTF